MTYEWDFGDGMTDGGGPTASHVYTQDGVYTAIFTATDGCGYSAVVTAPVNVEVASRRVFLPLVLKE